MMKTYIVGTVLSLLLSSAAAVNTFYPVPCGRGFPSGVCMTENRCLDAEGFWVGRACEAYPTVGSMGCCYNIPEDEDK